MNEEKEMIGYSSVDKPWLKYYSEEAINAPLPKCTIYELLWQNNKDHFDDIERAAKAFSALWVKKGEIVVVCTVE